MVAPAPSARERLVAPTIASLTLGLAPFLPEPHLVEKIRWIASGGEGMGAVDVFDVVMHGSPWVWLVFTLVSVARTPAAAESRSAPVDD